MRGNRGHTAIKMSIQELDKARVSSQSLDQLGDVVHHVKGIRPLVTLRPAFVVPRPRPVCIPGLHEPSFGVVQRERTGKRARMEEFSVNGFVEESGQDGDRIVIVCGKGELLHAYDSDYGSEEAHMHKLGCEKPPPSEGRWQPSLW
jgi:hypothetical protein